jgi:hypothetical protein
VDFVSPIAVGGEIVPGTADLRLGSTGARMFGSPRACAGSFSAGGIRGEPAPGDQPRQHTQKTQHEIMPSRHQRRLLNPLPLEPGEISSAR